MEKKIFCSKNGLDDSIFNYIIFLIRNGTLLMEII